MPFKSEKQRKFMWLKHPEIAEKWAHGEHSKHGKKKHKKRTVPKPNKDGYY